jgi:hypothetical protein
VIVTDQQNLDSPQAPNEAVIAKAVLEPEFRQALVDDPEQALQDAGIDLAPEDIKRITSLSRAEREEFMEQLESRQAALGITITFDSKYY